MKKIPLPIHTHMAGDDVDTVVRALSAAISIGSA